MSVPSARERWFPLVRELEDSGLPLPEFATRRRVNPSTLSWWRSLYRRESHDLVRASAPVFAELAVVEITKPHVILTLSRIEAKVRVDADTDLRLLRNLVDALC